MAAAVFIVIVKMVLEAGGLRLGWRPEARLEAAG
jgi:hypothetical protein